MAYRVELTARAGRNLRRIYRHINAEDSAPAHAWFNGLEAAILRLDEHPARGAVIPEDGDLRHLLYGNKPHIYRIIYAIDERRRVVTVLHIRHRAREAFTPEGT
jgi:plasmid stabilization system protein ParE